MCERLKWQLASVEFESEPYPYTTHSTNQDISAIRNLSVSQPMHKEMLLILREIYVLFLRDSHWIMTLATLYSP